MTTPLTRVTAAVTVLAAVLAGASACTAGSATGTTTGGLFDTGTVHTIDVTVDEEEYAAMVDTFQETGEKEWITATVTIDGQTYEDVGLKLKGNSSLQGLGGGGAPGGQRPDQDAGDEAATRAQDAGDEAATRAQDGQDAQGGPVPTDQADGQAPAAAPGGAGRAAAASEEEPERLPWRIQLDKFVDGQNHEGVSDIVVRSNTTETSLNEALSLALLGEADMATQAASSTRFSVNGSDQRLRLVLEMPKQDWYEENFSGDGILYKAEAGGSYDYRGDEAADYAEIFDIEAASGTSEDYTPLIDFLEFINDADDETFAEELDSYLEVEEFARYLALEDLIANTDDIDGPGNNSYLAYDADTGRMTVVAWDHNLAFGGMGGAMPGGGDRPEGFEPPAAGEVPEGFQPPTGGQGADAGTSVVRGGNVLSERFLDNEELAALVDDATADLTASLYESGYAEQVLDAWAEVLTDQAADLVDAETISSEVAAITDVIDAAGGAGGAGGGAAGTDDAAEG